MKHYAYKITNQIHPNRKVYIGETNDPTARWQRHKRVARSGPDRYPREFELIHRAMRKYGVENFTFELIDEAETKEEIWAKEIYWIAFYASFVCKELGYNLTSGGRGSSNAKKSKETIAKHQKSAPNFTFKGRRHTEEAKALMSKNRKGKQNLGETCANAKLKDQDIIAIRATDSTITQSQLANQYGVHVATIQRILYGTTWPHLPFPPGREPDKRPRRRKVLNDKSVRTIRKLWKQGKSQADIAKKLGVSSGLVNQVILGKIWKHVK